MSILTYNGVSIDILTINKYRLEGVYHNKNLLYTHHEVHASGVLNPFATSYTQSGTTPPKPARPGNITNSPATTVVAIKYALMQPRQSLTFSIEAQPPAAPIIVLQSPPQVQGLVVVGGLPSSTLKQDSNNGPIPLYAEVTQVLGSKTILIDFGIETWINDAYTANAGTILLSNTWSMMDIIDEDLYTDRIVKGEAVFDTRRLAANPGKGIPDQYRASFMHPIPSGFRRLRIEAEQNEDGNAVRYLLHDRENPLAVIDKGVTRIECVQSVTQEQGGLDDLVGGVLGGVEAAGDRVSRGIDAQIGRLGKRRRRRGRP